MNIYEYLIRKSFPEVKFSSNPVTQKRIKFILIFNSLGDISQAQTIKGKIKSNFPNCFFEIRILIEKGNFTYLLEHLTENIEIVDLEASIKINCFDTNVKVYQNSNTEGFNFPIQHFKYVNLKYVKKSEKIKKILNIKQDDKVLTIASFSIWN